jgi:outer membrane protein OmpA-like peptidoglycan-associated protein
MTSSSAERVAGTRVRACASLGAGLCAMLLFVAPAAMASDATVYRDRTVAVLDEIAAQDSGFGLQAWVNDGALGDVAIGQTLQYHFLSDRSAHLTVLHVDSHGVLTLIHPNAIGSGDALRAGEEKTFPGPEDGFTAKADPPLGRDYVLVVATSEPIDAVALGITLSPEPIAVVEAADAPALAGRLRARFLAFSPEDRASTNFEQRIVGRSETAEYASVDIVDYFTTRTRSIRRPKLDLHVHFVTGSHVLDSGARSNLDAVAEALSDPRMESMRFNVIGHTDDVGTTNYNEGLSQRRADTVVRYLTRDRAIDSARLRVDYFGETRPIESNNSAQGRQLNRRVEFELIR